MYFPVGWPRVLKIPEQGQWDVHQITCNRDRIFFAILSGDVLQIWYYKPCVPVVFHRRSPESLEKFGTNVLAEWKPDSSMIVIATSEGHLLLYKLGVISDSKGLYVQTDSPHANLRRDSAELFIKEFIPPLNLTLSEEIMVWDGKITGIVCITMSEFMVSTTEGHVLRYKWDGTQHRDYNLDLRRIPFCINQQVSRAIPILEENTYIVNIEYSPLVGGFSIVLNDGRAAFLTASSLKFDPNQVQGIWAQGIEDATCTTMNHKYRLITFGRANSECIVYYVDETTGGLEISHNCLLSSKDYPGDPGAVNQVLWTPDGCALAVTWSKGGLALWSTFGALLMCSLGWDYGLNVDIEKSNPLKICSMEWAQEGYQLWMIRRENYEEEREGETKNCQQKTNNFSSQKLLSRQHSQNLVESAGFVDNNKQLYSISGSNNNCVRQNHTEILHNSMDNSGRDPARRTTLIQMDFVKSALTINPCQSHQSHLYLQGGDKLYVNSADTLIRMFSPNNNNNNNNFVTKDDQQGALGGGGGGTVFNNKNNIYESGGQDAQQQQQQQQNMGAATTSTLSEGRQWLVIPIPSTYSATNWPIRYSAIDSEGLSMAVAGRTGLAHYSLQSRRWKLFGNETQEKDFIVAGGLMWWRDYVICGCYGIPESTEELRFYPRDAPRLDNKFARIVQVSSPILLMNILGDQLITFGSDAQVCIWALKQNDAAGDVEVSKIQAIDISALAVHPACIASVTLTSLRTETGLRGSVGGGLGGHHHQSNNNNNNSTNSESIVLNVSGRLLMVQREIRNNNGERHTCLQPTVLASCVENVWVPSKRRADKAHLTEALWLFCGAHGMRVWLPLYPKDGDNKTHTFMSKRIMLPFHLKIYPLAILFEDAIILGAENDTVLYTSDSNSLFSLPFSVLQRTSQVYLHQILRQLIRRNLGYHAWEIARSCVSLPYFPHSLELLLHEVLEEEATSKEPIPDAQLPSVIEFIMEFPSVYLQTVVQCARKTEIALWPYLFSGAGKPKDLFQECMAKRQLETAASYLIILQNLETSLVSRQYATLLLNTALDRSKWELAKDLVRFLRAIDPNDVESPRNSFILPAKLGLTQQTPPVSPNAEDLSLILGNVQGPRVRSYSTTISPKIPDSTSSSKLLGTSVPNSNNNNNNNSSSNNNHSNSHNMVAESPQTNRKKSMPNTATGQQQENTRDNPNSNSNQNHHNNSHNNNNGSGTSTAEEFFIDVILQKHARRLLQSKRLQDLGYFAAHLDFHLVRWLHKEIERAARVDDFVKALKLLHEDFAWPYPSLIMPAATSASMSGSSNNNGSNDDSLAESPQINVEDRLKSLKIDVNNFNPNNNNNNSGNHNNHESSNSRIGDSGYMSFQGYSSLVAPFLYTDSQICETENDSSSIHSQQSDIENPCQNKSGNAVSRKNSKIYEKKVKLHAHHYNVHRNSMTGGVAGFPENSLNLGKIQIQDDSNMSLASSSTATWCGNIDINSGASDDLDLGESGGNTSHDWEVPPSQILEQLSSSGNKGSHRAEVQLRYLLQLFMEAGCLEWSLLISVLLRDAMAVVRTVNAAKSHDQTVESVYRLRQGFLFLQYWTSTECLGYKAFMLAVQNQISVLTKILETKKMQFHHQQQQQQQNTMTFRNKNNNMAAAVMTSSAHHHQENQQYGVPQGSSIGAGGGGGLLMTSSLSRTRKISSSNSTTNHNTNSSIGAVSQDSSQIGPNPSQFFSLQNSTASSANQHHRALKRSTSGGGDSGRSSNEVTSVASHKADVKKQNSTGVKNLRNHNSSGMQEENGGEEEEEEGMIPESTGCVIS